MAQLAAARPAAQELAAGAERRRGGGAPEPRRAHAEANGAGRRRCVRERGAECAAAADWCGLAGIGLVGGGPRGWTSPAPQQPTARAADALAERRAARRQSAASCAPVGAGGDASGAARQVADAGRRAHVHAAHAVAAGRALRARVHERVGPQRAGGARGVRAQVRVRRGAAPAGGRDEPVGVRARGGRAHVGSAERLQECPPAAGLVSRRVPLGGRGAAHVAAIHQTRGTSPLLLLSLCFSACASASRLSARRAAAAHC